MVDQGAKEFECDTCPRPSPLPENEIILRLYSCSPLTPIPMTEGLIMLDLRAVEFLMDIYEVTNRRDVLERLIIYHSFMSKKI